MNTPSNDNSPGAPARPVRIIGWVGEGGRVVITDRNWRPTPTRPPLRLIQGKAADPT